MKQMLIEESETTVDVAESKAYIQQKLNPKNYLLNLRQKY